MSSRTSSLESLPVRNSELVTVREAMRGLNRMVDALEHGEAEKFVLMKGSRMVAVLVSVEQAAGGVAAARPCRAVNDAIDRAREAAGLPPEEPTRQGR